MVDDQDAPENASETTDDEDETIDDASDEAADDPGTARREPRTVPAGLFVLAVLVAGVLGILAVVALTLDDGGGDGDSASARTAAGEYAERFLALDHTDYDGWLEDMRSIGTAGFAESLSRNEQAIRTLLAQSQVTWEGRAIEVYVTETDTDVVSAVVLYDLQVTDRDGTRTIPDQYLRVDLVRSETGWLIERALSITADGSALTPGATTPPPPGTGAPTTSEPGG